MYLFQQHNDELILLFRADQQGKLKNITSFKLFLKNKPWIHLLLLAVILTIKSSGRKGFKNPLWTGSKNWKLCLGTRWDTKIMFFFKLKFECLTASELKCTSSFYSISFITSMAGFKRTCDFSFSWRGENWRTAKL